jgi:carboxypeptidase PM20D1
MFTGNLLISIGIGLLAIVLFLVGFILLKTVLFSPPQKKIKPREFPFVDGKVIAERLGLAIQYRTISYHEPQKFDANAFQGLHRLFKTLYPGVHTYLKLETVNDFSLLYTWEGSNPDLPPIMLIGHMDVVPADDNDPDWVHPPFSGELADGYVWGRGTLDMKSTLIGLFEAVEYLLKQGYKPERTVYLGFGHDEEVSGKNGAMAIVALLEERGVKIGSLLDEGGSVYEQLLPGVEQPIAMIGISEKGYLSLRLTVVQDGGHSSMPPQETAIGILSKAIARLEANPLPAHLEVIEFLMSYLGSALPFFQRMAFANTWLFGGLLKNKLSKSNQMNAIIRTTTAPTIISAGVKDNVLPPKAEAVVNFRLLPGDDLASVYKMVLERINDERVQVTPFEGDILEGTSGWNPSPVADVESPYFLRLNRLVREVFPDALVSPYLVIGGTDARHYAPLTNNAFRFSPVHLNREDVQSVHAVNERISFDNCAKLVKFYTAYIEEMASLPAEIDALAEDVAAVDEPAEEAIEDLTAWDDEDIPIPTVEETRAFAAGEAGEETDDADAEVAPDD